MSLEHHICCSSGLDKIFSCQCDSWGSCCTDDFLSVYLDRQCSSYNLSFRNVTYNLNIKTNIALFKFIKPLAFSKGEEYLENLILTTKGCNPTGMTLEHLPMLFFICLLYKYAHEMMFNNTSFCWDCWDPDVLIYAMFYAVRMKITKAGAHVSHSDYVKY